MAHPLDGAVAKFNRANVHAYALRKRLGGHPEGVDAIHDLDPDASEYVVQLEWELEFPWFPVIFGDAVHNFRSALDHLFCGLVVMNHRRVRDENFPICTTDPATDPEVAKRYNWLLGRIAVPQRTVIDGAQPYKRPNPTTEPLAVLGRLDNDDKHTQLTPHLVTPASFQLDISPVAECSILEVQQVFGRDLKLGADIGRVFYVAKGRHPQISVKTRMTPEIQLSKAGEDVFAFIARVQRAIHLDIFEPLIPKLAKVGGELFIDPGPDLLQLAAQLAAQPPPGE